MARRRRTEIAQLRSEIEANSPYLGLARAIQDHVDQAVADPDLQLDELAAAIDRWPDDARAAAIEAAFLALPLAEQWAWLADLFDDDELRAALTFDHDLARAAARRATRLGALVAGVLEHRELDTRAVPVSEDITLGLHREVDVRAAVTLGTASTATARRLVLRATEQPGRLLVLEDVFNPAGGLFVTQEYDAASWRAERLEPNTVVHVGAARSDGLEPVVHPGGRLDVEVAGSIRCGRLHTGFAAVGDVDLFVATRDMARRETG